MKKNKWMRGNEMGLDRAVTVPVGYDADDAARVVMDILLFHSFTAEQSIAHATQSLGREPCPQWEKAFKEMEETVVPHIRATCK